MKRASRPLKKGRVYSGATNNIGTVLVHTITQYASAKKAFQLQNITDRPCNEDFFKYA